MPAYLTIIAEARMSIQYHETLHRGAAAIERMRSFEVAICGAGALGANIAESLARMGFGALALIDRDRIEERNLSTQPYARADIGQLKARALANMLYRATGATADARPRELAAGNAGRLLRGARLVIDTFDNSASRAAVAGWCAESGVPCLHAGLAAGYGEVVWNDEYRVPSPANDDVCDYPLARNLAMIVASVACEAAARFVAGGERAGWTITLDDFAIRRLGA
jgi:molybdopterin/thiamine biosynthesis adenylyltransferase